VVFGIVVVASFFARGVLSYVYCVPDRRKKYDDMNMMHGELWLLDLTPLLE